VLGRNQQLIRLDFENKAAHKAADILAKLDAMTDTADILIFIGLRKRGI